MTVQYTEKNENTISTDKENCPYYTFGAIISLLFALKENATVFPYSNMFFPQLRRVDKYLSRLSPCT